MTETLAIDGGNPVRTRPFAPWPFYAADEIEAVQRVLSSGKVNYWTGQEGIAFEQEYARTLGRKYGLALMNGTVALELALIALGIGPGDEVITTPRSFVATASCIVTRGARPRFAEVDPNSGNVTVTSLEAMRTPQTRAVIVVHLGGWPCDMPAIMDWAREHGIKVIEDCAQAHGAMIAGRPVGAFGDAAAFSFCQDKIITTGGEGGLLVLDDEEAWRRAWSYKDHGKDYEAVHHRRHPPGFRWVHEGIGTNWRMTEMQAAIGRQQLTKLALWSGQRRHLATVLEQALQKVPGLRLSPVPAGLTHARYRYYAYVRSDCLRSGWSRDRIVAAINAEGVPCFVGSCGEIYREQAFVRAGLAPAQPLPIARLLAETSLAFLVHPTLDESDMYDVAEAVAKVMRAAVR